jgi:hypothetical protein
LSVCGSLEPGKVVVKNGRLVNVDEFKLAERANKAAARLYRKSGC